MNCPSPDMAIARESGVQQSTPTFYRPAHIAGTVVFTDGLPGCGKTMLSPIVGALDRVEMMRYNYGLEHTCILAHLGAIEPDAADSLLKIQTDLDLYNLMMARETNFRPWDLSSVWKDARPWRYVSRLFQAGDAAVIPRIGTEAPILHLVTHSQLCTCRALFTALGERLRIVEVVRHPGYMVKQWYAWMHRPGEDPRMFGLWIRHEGRALPWYAMGWEDLYLRSNRMDRTIYAIRFQSDLARKTYSQLSPAEQTQVEIIPFEQFVLDPEPFMARLECSLNTKVSALTRRVMRKQNVPRRMWAEGINKPIYRHYGWEPPAKGSDERAELDRRRQFVAAEATCGALEAWDGLCEQYESEYLAELIGPPRHASP